MSLEANPVKLLLAQLSNLKSSYILKLEAVAQEFAMSIGGGPESNLQCGSSGQLLNDLFNVALDNVLGVSCRFDRGGSSLTSHGYRVMFNSCEKELRSIFKLD